MKQMHVWAATGLLALIGPSFGATLQEEVERSLQKLQQRWNDGDHRGVAAFFASDARVVGEGAPRSIEGKPALDQAMQELVQQVRQVRIEIKEFSATGNGSAYAWVLWHITPRSAEEKPSTMRSLMVWSRKADGLKIRGDSYSIGDY